MSIGLNHIGITNSYEYYFTIYLSLKRTLRSASTIKMRVNG
jgi:hypothetical protein